MKYLLALLLAFVGLHSVSAVPALAPSGSNTPSGIEQKLAAFDAAAKAAIENNKDLAARLGTYRTTLTLQIRLLLRQRNEAEAISTVTQAVSTLPDDEVQKAGQALIAEIEAVRKAREDAAVDKITSVLKKVPEAVANAKKPSDLDGTLQDLDAIHEGNNNNYGNNEIQRGVSQAQSAYQFVAQWQEYLTNIEAGQDQQAKGNLRNLVGNEYGVNIVPRSKLLALLADLAPEKPASSSSAPKTAQADAIMDGIKALNDLMPAYKKLNELRKADQGSVNMADFQTLEQCASLYEDAKVGLPVTITISRQSNGRSAAASRIEAMTLLYLVTCYLNVKGDYAPAPDENIIRYLDRLAALSGSEGNWMLLKRVLEVETFLNRNNGGAFSATSTTGLNALLAGLSQETAGQYMLAVRSYQTALSNPSESVPSKLVGSRLDAIKKDHPQEYQAGMDLVLSPPAPRYPPAYMNPGFPTPVSAGANSLQIPGTPRPAASAPSPAAASAPAPTAATSPAEPTKAESKAEAPKP